MTLYSYNNLTPSIDPTAYIHQQSTVIGNCIIGANCTLWPGAVIRADNDLVKLGSNVNVQDNAVVHIDAGCPANIGDNVSIAHLAMVHGATIGANTLIGMGAVVMNNAVIGKDCIIGANTVIPAGKVIPARSLVVGTPGKVVREVTEDEIKSNQLNAQGYVQKGIAYKKFLKEVK
jgi:carbonic anhydrase/acetyltransferase-like protein (isoleucine patch superfamily)